MTLTYSAPQFTSTEEVSHLLEWLGVQLRTDEDPTDSDLYFVSFGTQRVWLYVHPFATRAELAANEWIRHAATVCAAYYLCLRGGEPVPESLAALYAELLEALEDIHQEGLEIPGLSPEVAKGMAPVFSNLYVDMRLPNQLRVNPATSSGVPEGYNVALGSWYRWSAWGWR